MMESRLYLGWALRRPTVSSQGSQVISGMLPRRLTAFSWLRLTPLWAQSAYHITIEAWAPTRPSNRLTSASWEGTQLETSLSASAGVVTPTSIGGTTVTATVGAGGAPAPGEVQRALPGSTIAATTARLNAAAPPNLDTERRSTASRMP